MRTIIVAALITGVVSIAVFRPVPARAQMEHGGMHMDEPMAAQHRLMAIYAQALAKINAALQKGDAALVKTETRKMLATIPELKKLTPHKNRKGQKAIGRIAAAFEADLKTTSARAAKRDLAGAREAFRKAEEKCAACHAKFRD
jgi:cytochrome c556